MRARKRSSSREADKSPDSRNLPRQPATRAKVVVFIVALHLVCAALYLIGAGQGSTQNGQNDPLIGGSLEAAWGPGIKQDMPLKATPLHIGRPVDRPFGGKPRGEEETSQVVQHLFVDKELYRPGDKVWVKAVVFNASSGEPVTGISSQCSATIHLEEPNGMSSQVGTVSGNSNWDSAVLAGSFKLDLNRPSGDYELSVKGRQHGCPAMAPGKRKFQVRGFSKTNPTLSMALDFLTKAYGQGDTVEAALTEVKRLGTGEIAARARASVIAQVDGEIIYQEDLQLDSSGSLDISFNLPKVFRTKNAQGSLSVLVQDGADRETISKSLPLVSTALAIDVYPEGGDLAIGPGNRIYVEAKVPSTAEPADFEGEIRAGNEVVARVQTYHEGRGVSTRFEVKRGVSYVLMVTKPSSVDQTVPLSNERAQGLLSAVDSSVTPFGAKVRVAVGALAQPAHLQLHLRDRLLYSAVLSKSQSEQTMLLGTSESLNATGVVRATLFAGTEEQVPEREKTPIAERLLFLKPQFQIETRVRVTSGTGEDGITSPKSSVTLEIETLRKTTAKGDAKAILEPIQATVGVRVTDFARESNVEERKRAPQLNHAVAFEAEVQNLFDAGAYLDDDQRLDLLLGTQGWRKFVFSTLRDPNTIDLKRVMGVKVPKMFIMNRGFAQPEIMAIDGQEFHMAAPEMAFMKAAGAQDGRIANDAQVMEVDEDKDDLLAEAVNQAVPHEGVAKVIADLADEVPDPQQHKAAHGKPQFGRVGRPERPGRPQQPVVQRVFAYKSNTGTTIRSDFSETLLWNPDVQTKEGADGRFTTLFSFDTNDAATTFRIHADAFDSSGALGSTWADMVSNIPTLVDLSMPSVVTATDKVLLPLVVKVGSESIKEIDLTLNLQAKDSSSGLLLQLDEETISNEKEFKEASVTPMELMMKVRFGPREMTKRITIPMNVQSDGNKGSLDSPTTYTVNASVVPQETSLRGAFVFGDHVSRELQVHMNGFPQQTSISGLLSVNTTSAFQVSLPGDVIPGTVKVSLRAYLSPIEQLVDVVDSLIQTPCGCFEQTSSTTYPMVLALRYLVSLQSREPRVLSLIEKAKALLRDGYKKLTSYETTTGGFEWFGNSPGHEALTGYGLAQFAEMRREELGLHGLVDSKMLERTTTWLLGRRDGKGQFLRNTKALDSFGRAPNTTTNAYILWSLARSGLLSWSELENEATWLASRVQQEPTASDPYVLALASNIFMGTSDSKLALETVTRLASMQNTTSGCISHEPDYSTITSSLGKSRVVEATALAVLAWLQSPATVPYAASGIRCLASSMENRVYGSTQATALSLQAIVAYSEQVASKRPEELVLRFKTNKDTKEHTLIANQNDTETLALDLHILPEETIQDGQLTLAGDKNFSLPYTIEISYRCVQPLSSPNATLSLTTSIQGEPAEGRLSVLRVNVENKDPTNAAGMSVAVIGVPSGFEPRMDRLSKFVKAGTIAMYEIQPSQVVLYWYGFKPSETVFLDVELEGKYAGRYATPASSVYQYYGSEHKAWIGGDQVEIQQA